jgi:ATP-dependent DNA ligase
MPYYERKDKLYQVFACNVDEGSIAEYVPYERDLEKAWAEVIEQDREGLILKRDMSAYEHVRSYSWLKAKNWRFEVGHVVGFTAGQRARSFFFGSLVLEKDGKFLGCAGSGFSEWELRKFKDMFTNSPQTTRPFSYEQVGEPYTAAKVDAQVLVKYYQMTDAKVMRFPIYILSS